MKRLIVIIFFVTAISVIKIFGQVTVEDENSLRVGAANNFVYSGYLGKYCQAIQVILGTPGSNGTVLESGNTESSGIYLDEDKVVVWSPGHQNLVNFCNENSFQSGGSYSIGLVAYINSAGYYYQVSDSTNKQDIHTIPSSLFKVLKMRGVEYSHKQSAGTYSVQTSRKKSTEDDDGSIEYDPEVTMPNPPVKVVKNTGFLAQEIEKILPEAVTTNESGIKFVNYQAVIPVLVEAVKEQQVQIVNQEKELTDIKTRLKQLEDLLLQKGLR